jgi:hypothetical protein
MYPKQFSQQRFSTADATEIYTTIDEDAVSKLVYLARMLLVI